jgi:transposase
MKLRQFMKIEQIEELMNKQKNKRDYERLLAIRLLMNGVNPDDVAEEINRSRATIYNWAEHWNENGWESLKYKAPSGKTPKLDIDDLAELKDILETKTPKQYLRHLISRNKMNSEMHHTEFNVQRFLISELFK